MARGWSRRAGWLSLLALPLLAAAIWLWPAKDEQDASRRPNIVLICVDALRSDHLGYQAYERNTSPTIDALAKRGAQFRYCFSTYPQTSPSVASLFTSLYPSAHKKTDRPGITLTSSVAPLAETFRRSGYRTAAVVTNPNLSPGIGYEQGFEHYCYVTGKSEHDLKQDPSHEGTEIEIRHSEADHYGRGDATNEAALDWLDRAGDRSPFLLYLHYMDVHNPYVSPDPYHSMFVDQEGRDAYCNGVPNKPVHPRNVHYMQSIYDGQIRYLDDLLALLLEELGKRGLLENTYIVFLSDHGDEFMEHGGLGHGETLFRELLHVPLFLVGPDIPARVHESVVSTIDIYPTLCELAGIDIPAHVQGESLVPIATGAAGLRRTQPVFGECTSTRMRKDASRSVTRVHGPGISIVDDDWHLIHRASTERTELYRYRDDPSEAVDLSATQPDEVARLLALAEQMLEASLQAGRAIETGETELDEATEEQLEALGYGGRDDK